MHQIEKFNSSLSHKAFQPESDQHQQFLQKLKVQIEKFQLAHSVNFSKEIEELTHQII